MHHFKPGYSTKHGRIPIARILRKAKLKKIEKKSQKLWKSVFIEEATVTPNLKKTSIVTYSNDDSTDMTKPKKYNLQGNKNDLTTVIKDPCCKQDKVIKSISHKKSNNKAKVSHSSYIKSSSQVNQTKRQFKFQLGDSKKVLELGDVNHISAVKNTLKSGSKSQLAACKRPSQNTVVNSEVANKKVTKAATGGKLNKNQLYKFEANCQKVVQYHKVMGKKTELVEAESRFSSHNMKKIMNSNHQDLLGDSSLANVKNSESNNVDTKLHISASDKSPEVSIVQPNTNETIKKLISLTKNVSLRQADHNDVPHEGSTYHKTDINKTLPADKICETEIRSSQKLRKPKKKRKESGINKCTDLSSSEEENEIIKSLVMKIISQNKCLLIMKHPSCVYLRGKLKVFLHAGCIEVLGYKITSTNPGPHEVYSPRGLSLLCLETVEEAQPNLLDKEKVSHKLVELGMKDSHVASLLANIGKNDSVLVLEEASSALVSYLHLLYHMPLFPIIRSSDVKRQFSKAEETLQCEFELCVKNICAKLYCKGPTWDDLSTALRRKQTVKAFSCTAICGGKGVGKSTLLRFLINQSLATNDQLLCLDFDPGQPEFTLPGCVSAVRVKKPLLGPNFTHQQNPERMVFVGEVDVSQCPAHYIQSIQHIIEFCHSQPELKHLPWIVNTMGFTKGLGVELIVEVIRLLKPTCVVQIESRDAKRNYPDILQPRYIWEYQSKLHSPTDIVCEPFNYTLHTVPSAAETVGKGSTEAEWGFRPKDLRDIMVISYFSQMVHPPTYSLTDIIPSLTPLSELTLCVPHEAVEFSQYLSVMNGNLVALCTTTNTQVMKTENPDFPAILLEAPVNPCLGFGIVRGVDTEAKVLYLITPVPESVLAKVNCLVKGTICLPMAVYLAPYSGSGQMPYIAEGPYQRISSAAKRVFRVPTVRAHP